MTARVEEIHALFALPLMGQGISPRLLAAVSGWSLSEASLIIEGLYLDQQIKPLSLPRTSDTLYLQKSKAETDTEIVLFLASLPGQSLLTISEALEISLSILSEHLRWLEARGFLTHEKGLWSVTPPIS